MRLVLKKLNGFIGNILIWLIKKYRKYRRYIFPGTAGCCKYIPTCSQYAIEAIKKYGALKGSFLAAWRILRCNPFSKGGYDPVP